MSGNDNFGASFNCAEAYVDNHDGCDGESLSLLLTCWFPSSSSVAIFVNDDGSRETFRDNDMSAELAELAVSSVDNI